MKLIILCAFLGCVLAESKWDPTDRYRLINTDPLKEEVALEPQRIVSSYPRYLRQPSYRRYPIYPSYPTYPHYPTYHRPSAYPFYPSYPTNRLPYPYPYPHRFPSTALRSFYPEIQSEGPILYSYKQIISDRW